MQKLLDKPLAIVDVETTGLSPRYDRVIELCVLRVEKGKIVDKLDTLVNPQTYISPFIESITGINKDEIERAPLFLELQDKVIDILKDVIFIAHNVNFDYSFIREELKRLDFSYSAKTLCTARLSRRLFPHYPAHNLSALIERYNFTCERRHRAYDDAHVLYQFLSKVGSELSKKKFITVLDATMKNFYSADERLRENIEDLPESAGVYIFYDKDNMPLYVGKSINIKERVKSHLNPTVENFKEFSIMKNLSRIEYIKTAGELGALLVESQKVKELQPMFNRKLRLKKKFLALVREVVDGFFTLQLRVLENFNDSNFEDLFGVFKSKKSMKETLSYLCKKYSLCPKIMGIEKTSGSCFEYKLGKCKGACIQEEQAARHNARFLIAYGENKQFKPWSFDGPIEITEKDEYEGVYEAFVIDKWRLIGRRIGEYEYDISQDVPFDLDSYKIMSSFLKHKKASIKKVDLSKYNAVHRNISATV